MVTTIKILGADAKIEGNYPIDVVVDITSYYKQGYRFMQRYRTGKWDGRIRLFSKFRKTFPAGLVKDVTEALEKEGVKVKIDDQRSCPAIPPLSNFEFNTLHGVNFDYPYDFQVDCMEKMVLEQRGVIAVATNGGKTEIACLVTLCLRLPTLFMVPGKELLRQTRQRFMTRLALSEDDIGMIGDGVWKPGKWITVATVASLHRNLKKQKCIDFLNSIELVFADEAHRVGADSWYQVLRSCPAFFRYGLSGTPLKRTDGADLRLIAATGPMIYKIKNKDLIERGISNQVEIRLLRVEEPFIDPNTPYQDVYKLGITENIRRNRALCLEAARHVEKGRRVVMLVTEIDHGHRLDSRLWTFKQKSFIPHQFIHGKESSEVREKALKDFENGDLKVLISSTILDEGVDTPCIDVLILAGGMKSYIKALQRIGRGIRKGGTSNKLIVIDTADFQHRYLLKHSLERLEAYKSEDCFEIVEVKK